MPSAFWIQPTLPTMLCHIIISLFCNRHQPKWNSPTMFTTFQMLRALPCIPLFNVEKLRAPPGPQNWWRWWCVACPALDDSSLDVAIYDRNNHSEFNFQWKKKRFKSQRHLPWHVVVITHCSVYNIRTYFLWNWQPFKYHVEHWEKRVTD